MTEILVFELYMHIFALFKMNMGQIIVFIMDFKYCSLFASNVLD